MVWVIGWPRGVGMVRKWKWYPLTLRRVWVRYHDPPPVDAILLNPNTQKKRG